MSIIKKIGNLLTEDPDVFAGTARDLDQIINEVGLIPQDKQFRGSFVVRIPFVHQSVADGKKIKAGVLAEIVYTWDSKSGINIYSYDELETFPKEYAHLLSHAAMEAISKKVNNGSMDKAALQHFQNTNKTGQKAAKEFKRPRKLRNKL